ncbi:hypothetical protein EGR_10851 [Echinococcus granulosus]|uniref:Uncharacterized protein n=1 Tax=Echinococcus granulosus TaxID=6210 RepID=W6TZN0_ECHGR|nr:hypothetical protein EGR_10851 [Echinococcus granulosus]EUB54290.1 hypothetical protein EGR_10851 [Echinococcus granulosus]
MYGKEHSSRLDIVDSTDAHNLHKLTIAMSAIFELTELTTVSFHPLTLNSNYLPV